MESSCKSSSNISRPSSTYPEPSINEYTVKNNPPCQFESTCIKYRSLRKI
jgi:hypothetical protein